MNQLSKQDNKRSSNQKDIQKLHRMPQIEKINTKYQLIKRRKSIEYPLEIKLLTNL